MVKHLTWANVVPSSRQKPLQPRLVLSVVAHPFPDDNPALETIQSGVDLTAGHISCDETKIGLGDLESVNYLRNLHF